MGDSLDAYQYASHLRSRWRFVALACAEHMLTARRGAAQADVAAFEQRVREFRGAVASRDD